MSDGFALLPKFPSDDEIFFSSRPKSAMGLQMTRAMLPLTAILFLPLMILFPTI